MITNFWFNQDLCSIRPIKYCLDKEMKLGKSEWVRNKKQPSHATTHIDKQIASRSRNTFHDPNPPQLVGRYSGVVRQRFGCSSNGYFPLFHFPIFYFSSLITTTNASSKRPVNIYYLILQFSCKNWLYEIFLQTGKFAPRSWRNLSKYIFLECSCFNKWMRSLWRSS